MKLLDIGVLSEKSGLPPSTLRYYEEIGLIRSVGRHGLRRQFDAPVVTQIALISLGKMAGFSLEDIKAMFARDGSPQLPRAELHLRADALDDQIRGLTRLRDALRHVADCPEENHMDCPKFKRLMQFAARSMSAGKR
ncbi:Redox-sensitive transcriptional activator SoxR [Roseovarius sp. THAF27]|uniref:helix-turn-helix domain-containing protein n=1 Tax=unclassified Roseovarius TaxID=2614913 RepID=UPI001267A8B0|nr:MULTISPECIES: helix-turn-helix domain-containing protein [unclassified Roseovarius]QFT79178.1 Redox-sensitive transcriptional activator SoxR [Roseovarius sp. THAF27]QFT97667.1 Redox-sensitive transcriptional activator SoxR [Roseovarius sp. THAF8]